MASFDIVICVGPNDAPLVKAQLEFTKKNIKGYRTIFLVYGPVKVEFPGCVCISESIFPFSKDEIETYIHDKKRCGWYLQQLIKLYAGFVLPDILNKWLVIDADSFFLKPVSFFEDGKSLLNFGSEYHRPYFEHMKRLHPTLHRMNPALSGITHHMLFDKEIIDALFNMVSEYNKKPFFQAFLSCIDPAHFSKSGASEYEIYFNFALKHFPQKVLVRGLNWSNQRTLNTSLNYDYIACHWYDRIVPDLELE